MASRDQKDAFAGMVRRSLARDAMAGNTCPEPEVLAAYFDRALDTAETEKCDVHLSRCGHCRKQLAAMVRAEQVQEAGAKQTQHRPAWLLDWRSLTAAAAVMVLVTVWMVRRPENITPRKQDSNTPLVAMKKAEKPKSSGKTQPVANAPIMEPDAMAASRQAAKAPAKDLPLRDDAVLDRLNPHRKAAPGIATKVAPVRTMAPAAPSSSEADSATTITGAPARQEKSLAKESPSLADRERDADATRAFDDQQNRNARSESQIGQAQRPTGPSQSVNGQLQANTQYGVGGGMGAGQAKTQANSATNSPASKPAATPQGGATGGVAGATTAANEVLDTESIDAKKAQTNSRVKTRYVAGNAVALQVLEERSSGKIIDTPDPKIKWRINSAGFVERSDDGGATWNGQELDANGSLLAGSAPDAKTCWVVGRGGAVYVTKDAEAWKKLPAPAQTDLVVVIAADASSATVTTADGERFATHNRGKKWTLVNKPQGSSRQP